MTRSRGWALVDEEAEAGVRAIAVATPGRAVPGTVSVAGPLISEALARKAQRASGLRQGPAGTASFCRRGAGLCRADGAA